MIKLKHNKEFAMKNKKGFTLIELLVVIVLMISILIISIISLVSISNRKKEEAEDMTVSFILLLSFYFNIQRGLLLLVHFSQQNRKNI